MSSPKGAMAESRSKLIFVIFFRLQKTPGVATAAVDALPACNLRTLCTDTRVFRPTCT